MANVREVKERMGSIKETKKITNAMYLISSSKMKQAKKKLADTEPFFYAMQGELSRILRHLPDMRHHFFNKREKILPEDRKIGCIVITADKGLAGAYNHNVIKMAEELLEEPGEHKLFVLGELGRQYFCRKKKEVDVTFQYTVQNPTMHRARVITGKILELFHAGDLDEVYIIFTMMENAVQVSAQKIKLLPLARTDFGPEQVKIPLDVRREDIVLYPSAESVMDSIIPNYINGIIYGCLVESYCSEQNSRMMAMQNATDSATDMLNELNITYNRVRQANITQELTEVIGGANAQKRK
ncbi:MAG: ATP synthase F1 subunit gamma [Lachnospiraceae bacterium]